MLITKTHQAVAEFEWVVECAAAADMLANDSSVAEPYAVEAEWVAAWAPGVRYFILNTLMLYGSNYIICIFSDKPLDIWTSWMKSTGSFQISAGSSALLVVQFDCLIVLLCA